MDPYRDPLQTQPRPQPRSGFTGFMTTVPGVLTALAGLVTAAGGVYVAVAQNDGPIPQPTPTIITVAPAPMPEGSGTVDPAQAADEVDTTSVDDATAALIDDCAAGSYTACQALLDTLVQDCYDGDGPACDVVYEVSEPGSDYEDYGATCGGRFDDWTYADQCSTL